MAFFLGARAKLAAGAELLVRSKKDSAGSEENQAAARPRSRWP